MPQYSYEPIGVIRSPYTASRGTPIQPAGARDARGVVEVFEPFADGLLDIDGFSHLILLYHFHISGPASLTVRPFMDDSDHGVFATRAPARPNPIGLSIVRLAGVEGNLLHVLDVDVLDGTPLLDIKPHVEEFHVHGGERIGWLEGRVDRVGRKRDDGRFRDR
ncbi:MAG: tRNA (N6-threonylcarbamoyladenosine(37)-N6)-methyltransferase TrmO [Desulfatibacillaceae bacterium]